jgi:23S rRNA pseudouridine1911/1915/1917 synthase
LKEQEEEGQLFEHYRYVVDGGQSALRIDKWLFNKLENISRNKIQEAAAAGNILVNDKEVKANYKVRPEDVVTIVFDYPPREIEIIVEDIPLDIQYEDDDIIIINKKHGNGCASELWALFRHFGKCFGFSFEKPAPV